MRGATHNDVIATWFVTDSIEDASQFPQTGHDSSKTTFQDIYWRCIVCFHATAFRQAPHAKHVLYTNCETTPVVDDVQIGTILNRLGVEIRVLPIHHRLGRGKVKTWNNQFYILDIIKDLVARDDFATIVVLDSDCVWVRPVGSLLSDVERRGLLSLCIPYTEEFNNNGATRFDMQRAASQLTDMEFGFVPHYSGGELFAATRQGVADVWKLAEPMWKRLSEAEPGEIKIYEEGQFLSIIYEALNIPIGTADAHCRRMWTALRLNTVTVEDIYSSRCIWHLPMEKKTGFPVLFKVACNPQSWLWTRPLPDLAVAIARCMGIPKRTPTQWFKHVVSRTNFHIERLKLSTRARLPNVRSTGR